MSAMKNFIDIIYGYIWEFPKSLPYFLVLLLGTGIFLTIRMRFIQLRRVKHSLMVIAGKYDNPNDSGEINHFQALSAALSATIGIGNIAGVATAIHYGGPGALFWMWVTAILGTASKFTECTLSTHFRKIGADGVISGGPMYYIEKGMGNKWKFLAVIFSVCAIISSFGSGNSVQAFTVADSFRSDFGIPTWITGSVMATLVGLVIIGGIRRIGKVASKLVPFMAGIYFVGALTILLMHAGSIPRAFITIVSDAFSAKAGVGGFFGSSFMFMLIWGVKRGIFSNEAGQGSAPIAHAAAKTEEPAREGVVAMLGPYIDTLLICTLTGLTIVTLGVWKEKKIEIVPFIEQSQIAIMKDNTSVHRNGVIHENDIIGEGRFKVTDGHAEGVIFAKNNSTIDDALILEGDNKFNGFIEKETDGIVHFIGREKKIIEGNEIRLYGKILQNGSPLTAWAFEKGMAPLFKGGKYIVTIAVFLFALSTAISWSYYGDRNVEYLFGAKAILPYRIIFCIIHFLGAIFSLELVWTFGDTALGLMAIPNLIAIIVLSGKAKKIANDYFSRF
ncbi:sodium:alanine symporter family protein [bacterium]|nr:sodium:alanine symporter family protein [bacterium]